MSTTCASINLKKSDFNINDIRTQISELSEQVKKINEVLNNFRENILLIANELNLSNEQ